MDIVVAGRHLAISDGFRQLAEEKLSKVTLLAPRAQRVDVVVSHERNPRLTDVAHRVEITVIGKGPVVRAEASASDQVAALDIALGKLFERLRRLRDRRKDHQPRGHVPTPQVDVDLAELATESAPAHVDEIAVVAAADGAVEKVLGDSPVIIREKTHKAAPMSLDDALNEMELVGHDFFLFVDEEGGQPAVVYRRRGWSYGVIRLEPSSDG